jgi:uncharacterized protein (TIGR03437 family)
MKALIVFLVLACSAAFGQTPKITATVSSATFQNLNNAPGGPTVVMPRSLLSVFGENLSSSTSTAESRPLPKTLAGVQLIVANSEGEEPALCGDPKYTERNRNIYCETPVELYYVSPTQINFVVPNSYFTGTVRILLVKDGVRHTNLGTLREAGFYMTISAQKSFLFEVGFDCPALSTTEAAVNVPCGYARQRTDPNQITLGAITDGVGNLITTANPLRPGASMTIWSTGLGHVRRRTDGLMEAENSAVGVRFGIVLPVEEWSKIPGHQFYDRLTGVSVPFVKPSFAGEAPQFPGLDQVNVAFPGCQDTGYRVTVESRYDVRVSLHSGNATAPMSNVVTAPMVVKPGDIDCKF